MAKTSWLICMALIGCLFIGTTYSQCVTLYTDYNFRGNVFQVCGTGNVPAQYNDQVSSFVVPAGYSVKLFRDYNQQGPSYGPYNQGSYNVPAEFNDQLSSITVTQNLDPKCVTLYTDYNFQGNVFQLCSSGNVPSQFNDQVSSFKVPAGLSVKLFRDYGYSGPAYGPYTEGSYNVPSEFNDQLSSLTVGPALDPNCVTLYTDYNYQGNVFQLCSSGNVPSQYNDQVSSFKVPAGLSVKLYRDYGYSGPAYGPYYSGSFNVPAEFNDQLSSLTISPACITFYVDYNLQGSSFQLCGTGNVPSTYNDQVSSFVVPPGLSVTLYRDYGQQGPSFGPYTQGTYNVPSQFNDQLSSVAVQKQ